MNEARYAIDLEPGQEPEGTFTLAEMAKANECFDSDAFAGMAIGEVRLEGGGAWASYTLTRMS
jgi:hypothetical protein